VQVLSDRAVYAEMVGDLARQIAAVRLADMPQARASPLRGGGRVALGASGSWGEWLLGRVALWASGSWGEWLLGRPALQEEKERGEKRAAARQRAPSRALSHARVAGMWQAEEFTPPPLRTNRTRRVPHPVLIGHAASLSQAEEFTAEVERRLSLLSDENQAPLPSLPY
jgi:hypothetical protein